MAQPRQPRKRAVRIVDAPAETVAETQQLSAPTDTPASPEPAPITSETLAAIDGDIAQMESLRAALLAQQDAVEQVHARHAASSPLALRLEVVGCRWAAETYPEGPHAAHIPQYTWGEMRCPFGKERPDQDCRDCTHHRITPLDYNEQMYTRRYPHYGPIIPLSDEEATALSHYLRALNKPPLRRVASEIHAVDLALERARAARAAEARREMERQQGGR